MVEELVLEAQPQVALGVLLRPERQQAQPVLLQASEGILKVVLVEGWKSLK